MTFVVIVSACIIFLLGIAGYNIFLILVYRKHRGPDAAPEALFEPDELPRVTIQLPVYNERMLARQCLTLAASLDYPPEKLEIQYIDESDDVFTSALAEKTIEELKYAHPAISFQVLRRGNLKGFKAGGLAYATERATGEFIAIFDADFEIPRDFLSKTIHYFKRAGVGVVQARWNYKNCDNRLFTRLQAEKLDAHQMFEQAGRGRSAKPIIFHGTAGIWRTSALLDSGGWDCETEVEDAEVSIRSALKGWEIVYLDHLRINSELPETITGYLGQQMRWRRGWSRLTPRYSGEIVRSKLCWRDKFDLLVRIHVTWAPIAALLMTLACLPYFLVAEKYGFLPPAIILYTSGLIISLLTNNLVGKTLREDPQARPKLKLNPVLKMLPLSYLLLTMGTLWPLVQATLSGLFGQVRSWEVTPKTGAGLNANAEDFGRSRRAVPSYVFGTLLLGLIGVLLGVLSLMTGHYIACFFYGMLFVGCSFIGLNLLEAHGYSLGHLNKLILISET